MRYGSVSAAPTVLDRARETPSISEEDVRLLLADPTRVSLVAQPIVDLRRGRIVGYETLARFSLGKPAPPDRVFAAAVCAGLGEDLEALVVGRALTLASDRPSNCFVSINVEPMHILSPKVVSVFDSYSDLSGIVFELTEHRSLEDVQGVRRALDNLRNRGAFVAIDDAGSGYSGLKQILDLEPQFLKIDRALVTEVHTNEAKRALIQMLGELAGRLDAWVIAEGIETEAELHALCQLGVPLGQGYFLSRPGPPWANLSGDAERALRSLPKRPTGSTTLQGLVEPCVTCEPHSDWDDATEVSIRVDEFARPTQMRLFRDEGERIRSSRELLRVKADSDLSAVGLRAATRPERLRWDPLVCIDDDGKFVGVIPMQRLVCALATAPDKQSSPPSERHVDFSLRTRH